MRRLIGRTLAVARTDVRARLRRPAFAWLLAALALTAYFTIPSPSSASGLFVIDGARARYSSEALAFATAALIPIFLGLFGFYVVSRAVGHDAATQVGPLVAATPVRRGEYLLGKYLGSTVILGVVVAGFLACILGMHLVRAEAPLRPLVYLSHYLALGLPCVLGVAALALFFECFPGLGGRAGEALYFFVWAVTMPLALEPWKGGPTADPSPLARVFDWSGLGFAVAQAVRITGSSRFSIGATPYDPGKPAVEFPGLSLTPETVGWRLLSLVFPALLLLAAALLFHRFDPARSRPGSSAGRRSPLALAQTLARPLVRLLLGAVDRPALASRSPAALRTLSAEVLLTARLNPLLLIVVVAAVACAVSLPLPILRGGALPALVALLVPLVAEIPVRERQAGVSGIVYPTPGLGGRLIAVKLATTATVALLVVGAPASRLFAEQPSVGVSLLMGALLLASGSVLLGTATASPKPFMALALGFWYVALSAGSRVPALDFAGFAAVATPAVQLGYGAATFLMAAAALALERSQRHLAD